MAASLWRPVVRSYSIRQVGEAAAHIRRGGHAIVWSTAKRARLIVPFFEDDDIVAPGWWAILDLRKQRYRVIRTGALKGFIETLVPPDCQGIVRQWLFRDELHRGSVRRIRLDCLACGACCLSNEVVLDDEDAKRFVAANRRDLLRPPYARRADGKLVLRLDAKHACHHKRDDNKCAVYDIRPGMCREFPVGSECCLSARAEELGVWDGREPPPLRTTAAKRAHSSHVV